MEQFDICNADGSPAGYTASRDEAHRKGLLHRTVHVWIVNTKGKLLLQKRAMDKEVYPGCWDISCAGHVSSGESTHDAAIRELQEELGIVADKSSLRYLFTQRQYYRCKSSLIIDNEITDVFLLHGTDSLNTYRNGNGEVTDVMFVDCENLINGKINPLAEHHDEFCKLQSFLQVIMTRTV